MTKSLKFLENVLSRINNDNILFAKRNIRAAEDHFPAENAFLPTSSQLLFWSSFVSIIIEYFLHLYSTLIS